MGWIQPHIVRDLEPGDPVDITIGSLAATGDAIVIPAAGAIHDGPFNEYMIVDLFAPEGLNRYDAADFQLQDTVGVRIYHVDSRMERRELSGSDGKIYPIGTIHYACAYEEDGKYLIELLQAGRKNTFTSKTNTRSSILPQDLFQEGAIFTAEGWSEFLTDGRMDDGSEFGYSIQVLDIREDSGSYFTDIRITRK